SAGKAATRFSQVSSTFSGVLPEVGPATAAWSFSVAGGGFPAGSSRSTRKRTTPTRTQAHPATPTQSRRKAAASGRRRRGDAAASAGAPAAAGAGGESSVSAEIPATAVLWPPSASGRSGPLALGRGPPAGRDNEASATATSAGVW